MQGQSCALRQLSIYAFLLGFSLISARADTPKTPENLWSVPQFKAQPRHRDAGLKAQSDGRATVYDLGDSVSWLQFQHLAAALDDIATVQHAGSIPASTDGNCLYTGFTLEHFDEWVGPDDQYDVIICNWGLHDIARVNPDGSCRTSPAQYRANLRALFTRLWPHAGAIVVPLTTWVPPDVPGGYRLDADARAYNAILRDEAMRAGAVVVNLYGVSACHPEWYAPGDVHPYPGGEALAAEVARAVRQEIAPVDVPALGWAGLLGLGVVLVAVSRHPAQRARPCRTST